LNKLNKLKVYLEREIEREKRKIYLVTGLHLKAEPGRCWAVPGPLKN
jgi:hypothetical protein